MIGISAYGTYVPQFRLSIKDIAQAWSKDGNEVAASLGLVEKSVPASDEDAVTIALEAAQECLSVFSGKPSDLDVLFVGSESHPYAVNPTSTIVGELLGVGHTYLAADLEFACKAATAGVQAIAGLVAAGHAQNGLIIGADTAQGKPHDFLEYTAAAGGAAFIVSHENVVAKLLGDTSYSSDTPDFWRRDGMRYPSHAGRFTGEPAYFAHVLGAAHRMLEMTKLAPADFDYCVFHMPNGKFPREAAKRLGFTKEQLAPSLVVDKIGNSYSATTLLGLAAVLDIAKPQQKIFMVSYGSGAGSDAFVWETTEALIAMQKQKQKNKQTVADHVAQKTLINYVQFLKQTHKLS
ncbi:hydroxymethylglutaryl-CoA synthase [Candidatus Woesebacteria bacterium]|jgi:hydroxymethylglutaryl-CoA synthase|nr:hydroxymethylglutaryl-CoA synthase [Candidatus Woesebacteria bacterium]